MTQKISNQFATVDRADEVHGLLVDALGDLGVANDAGGDEWSGDVRLTEHQFECIREAATFVKSAVAIMERPEE